MAEQTPITMETESPQSRRPESRADVAKDISFAELAQVDGLAITAAAWIDRWRALGGDFGRMEGPEGRVQTLGRLIEPSLWHPTDNDRDDLPPHVWLVEPEHHEGGVKALEGLLVLSPPLKAAVRAIAAKMTGAA